MSEMLGLSRYVMVSALLHGLAGGLLGQSVNWAGMPSTHRMDQPLEVMMVAPPAKQIVPRSHVPPAHVSRAFSENPSDRKITPEFPMKSEPVSLDSASDHGLAYHGVKVSDQGVSEQYTSRLHGFLQRYFREAFESPDWGETIEFSLRLDILADGQIKEREVSAVNMGARPYLAQVQSSVRNLKQVPAPRQNGLNIGEFSAVIPVVFRHLK